MDRDGLEQLRAVAREREPDLYAAALLAPAPCRIDLIAVAAFIGEVRRIPLSVSDPNLALIRLQWWREAIGEAGEKGGATGNPVADAIVDVLRRRAVSRTLALRPLDAVEAELYDEPMGAVAFAAYLDDVGTALFLLQAAVLGIRADGGDAGPLIESAGRAWAATALALKLPYHLRMRRLPRPVTETSSTADINSSEAVARGAVEGVTGALIARAREEAARAQPLWRRARGLDRQAVLTFALIEPYLEALQRPGRDPLREPAELAPLTRVTRLWLARRRFTS